MKQDPHEQQAMQPLVSAFRQAMNALDQYIRKEGAETDLFSIYNNLSQLAQTLVHQFDNQVYELSALRRQLEETQLASQKLKTQFDYREKREAILEQAYVETQLALQSSEMLLKRSEQDKYEIQKHARHLERSHASLVAEHGELKVKAEQVDAVVAEHQRSVHVSNATFNDLQGQIGDLKAALALKKEDNSRLHMVARNRRHALIEVGNFLASDLEGNRTPKALSDMIEKVAAMARPVDYRTGEPLEGVGVEGAPASDTPEPSHTAVVDGMFIDAQPEQEVAEKLGYSKRAHDFPPGENMKDVACLRCGIGWLEAVDVNHYCQAVEADENGVHLGAQITSVAEAIQNGESQH